MIYFVLGVFVWCAGMVLVGLLALSISFAIHKDANSNWAKSDPEYFRTYMANIFTPHDRAMWSFVIVVNLTCAVLNGYLLYVTHTAMIENLTRKVVGL